MSWQSLGTLWFPRYKKYEQILMTKYPILSMENTIGDVSWNIHQNREWMHEDPEGERQRIMGLHIELFPHHLKAAETELKTMSSDCTVCEFYIISESFHGVYLGRMYLLIFIHLTCIC